MFNALRIAASFVSLIAVPVHPVHGPALHVVITGVMATERQLVEQTLSIFDQAGLALPPLEIHRHHDVAGCQGKEGLHRTSGQRSVIDICTAETGEYEQRTLIHELGHAWSQHFLGADRKAAFEQLRGWQYWLDYGHAKWEDNGAEQASEIIVWALSPRSVAVVKIDQNSCQELHDGYVALTGREPLHGDTKLCRASASKSVRS